jgi:hypothetical protein
VPRACCGAPSTPEKAAYNFNVTAKCGEPGATACADPTTHWSWDGIHLTEAAYRHIAKGWLYGPFADQPIVQSSWACNSCCRVYQSRALKKWSGESSSSIQFQCLHTCTSPFVEFITVGVQRWDREGCLSKASFLDLSEGINMKNVTHTWSCILCPGNVIQTVCLSSFWFSD